MTAPRREGTCKSIYLRRGDVLYLPSRTWHWTGPGPKASCHLEFGVVPLTASDLVMALGARNMLHDLGHPAMAAPLPLWKYRRIEDAADDVIPFCYDLPWSDAPVDIQVICTPATVRMALMRLGGTSGRSLPHWHPTSGRVDSAPTKPWPRPKPVGLFAPLMEVLQPFAQIVGMLGILLLLACFCAQVNKTDKPRRPMRSAATILSERKMLRKSRMALQNATKSKKMD